MGLRSRWMQALLLCSLITGQALSAEREKTDVIVLQNGDRYTGRILYAQYGYLHLSAQHSGTLSIEWPSIHSIQTIYTFRVERFGGLHYEGPITTTEDGADLIVGAGAVAVTIPMREVSRLVAYESSFWDRIDGSVSLGYSSTKSSGTSEGSFGFKAEYSDVDIDAALNASALLTKDRYGNSTDQDQIQSLLFFLRPSPNFWGVLGNVERDRNLGIDARAVAGAVLGRRLLQTESSRILGVVGFDAAQEWPAGGYGNRSSVEGVIGAEWRVFKFANPNIKLDSSLLLYPSVTDSPRLRSSLNITLTFKLTDRFALKFSENGMYDSRPPTAAAETSDYGVSISISYEFGTVVF
jgi:putative salt-induced outer membrane protein YdiY